MLMKIGSKDHGPPDGLGIWTTGLSWYDEGEIHPITANVVYSVPHFEVVDVTLDYDKKKVEVPSRMAALIVASAVDEYIQATPALRLSRQERKTNNIDPMFLEE